MNSSVAKWGNSLAIRIPKKLVTSLQITEGTTLNISVEKNRIVLEKPKYDLSELVSKISSKNRHEEVFNSPPVGKETW